MVLHVVLGEGGDEEVGVVVAGLHSHVHWVPGLAAGSGEVLWQQLVLVEEGVASALVDQDWGLWSGVGGHELGGIVGLACFDRAEVAFEGFLSPWALSWVADRREGRDRPVNTWVLQEDGEGTMSTHAVSSDTSSRHIDMEVSSEESWKLLSHISVHVVMLLPFVSSSIDIESSTRSKIVGIVLSFDFDTSGTGVWEDDGDSVFFGFKVQVSLCSGIIISASESSEIVKHWWWCSSPLLLSWNVNREFHVAVISFTSVRDLGDVATVLLNVCQLFEGASFL